MDSSNGEAAALEYQYLLFSLRFKGRRTPAVRPKFERPQNAETLKVAELGQGDRSLIIIAIALAVCPVVVERHSKLNSSYLV